MTKKKSEPKSDPRKKQDAPAGKATRPKPSAKAAERPASKKPAAKAPVPVARAAGSKSAPAGGAKKIAAPAKEAPSKKAPPKKPAPEAKGAALKPKPGAKEVAKKPPKPAKQPKPVKPSKAAIAARDAKTRAAAKQASPPSLADAKAAALKLAAAAGLRPVEKHSENGDSHLPKGQKLTKSPLGKKELERFREILLLKRAQVVGDVSAMESEALSASSSGALSSLPQHMADQGSDEYDQSLALGLAASQRTLLREIDQALDRIDRGDFGVCEVLGTAIHKDRLEATPWARYSLDGARMIDRRSHQR